MPVEVAVTGADTRDATPTARTETGHGMHLTERRAELSSQARDNHRYYLRRFCAWCEREDFENRNNTILSYREKYHYASRNHALFIVLWHTGMRMGAARSLDLDDFDRERQSLELVHRPDEETTLKNAKDGERMVALSEDIAEANAEYIDHKRKDRVDDYGREPLFTTKKGCISKNTIQQTACKLARPCVYSGECPHDYDPDSV